MAVGATVVQKRPLRSGRSWQMGLSALVWAISFGVVLLLRATRNLCVRLLQVV